MKHEPIHFVISQRYGDETREIVVCHKGLNAPHILTTTVAGNETCLKCQDWVEKNHKDKVNERFKF